MCKAKDEPCGPWPAEHQITVRRGLASKTRTQYDRHPALIRVHPVNRHLVENFGPMISGMQKWMLCSNLSDGRFGGNGRRRLRRLSAAATTLLTKPDFLRFLWTEVARGVRKFTNKTLVSGYLGQSSKCAAVNLETHIDLLVVAS